MTSSDAETDSKRIVIINVITYLRDDFSEDDDGEGGADDSRHAVRGSAGGIVSRPRIPRETF